MIILKYRDETDKQFQKRVLARFDVDPKLRADPDTLTYISIFCRNIPQKFLIKWADLLDWDNLCCSQYLSNDFMDCLPEYMNWKVISWGQRLTEWFMDKYKDKLDWVLMSERQKMSEKFVIEHIDRINLECLLQNKNSKFGPTFWRSIFAAYPEWQIPDIKYLMVQFDINFIREFRDRFEDLTSKFIDAPKEKKAKIWHELGIHGSIRDLLQ